MQQDEKVTDVWRKYRNGVDHHNKANMYELFKRCYRFFEGDQWHGCNAGDEELPMENFIKPICKYKTATVAMNDTAIIFSPMGLDGAATEVCEKLQQLTASQWERLKMDSVKWSVVKAACVAGDAWLYFHVDTSQTASVGGDNMPRLAIRQIDRTSVYLADEQNPVLSEQEYIIIAERRSVRAVREEARKNKVPEDDIRLITADDADETQVGVTSADEVKTELGKCTSLLYMELTKDGLKFCRSVKNVVYQPEDTVQGVDVYPLVCMRWEEKQGSARGISGVERLIPNQIEVNKTLARRAICAKRFSFPTKVVDVDKISNADALDQVGATVEMHNLAGNPISSYVGYITPVGIGTDAPNLQAELVSMSRELEGASDAATGSVDPTKASGEAIKAARDQSALTLNEQSAFYKQFVEDIATVWCKLMAAYGAGITPDELDEVEFDIKIDVSPVDPYSVLARQMALENALAKGHITFDEYVDALDDNSGVPKEKFKKIIESRAQMQTAPATEQDELPPAQEELIPAEAIALAGGDSLEMPVM